MNFLSVFLVLFLFTTWLLPYPEQTPLRNSNHNSARYIFVFIGDGMGENHILATEKYTSQPAPYKEWLIGWVSTYPQEGNYDPSRAWSDFNWVQQNLITDSAAAATALFSGKKTTNGRINVSPDGSLRYKTITQETHEAGLSVGAVTSVPISHATPGAWIAHNASRQNGYAIANEGIWGDPNTTGEVSLPFYGGGYGSTFPPIDVLIGGGHPDWYLNNPYVDDRIVRKLRSESDETGKHRFIERIEGQRDGGMRLLTLAENATTRKLVGIFGGSEGNLEYRLADGLGTNPENPSLAEMTTAAIRILNRNPNGFILLVEGGAIDFASHQNNLNKVIGEVIDFNKAVQGAVDWVNDPDSPATWSNTLFLITADHETGHLTNAPKEFPNHPLGEISQRTLQLERNCLTTCLRASWEDNNANMEIDQGETVHWAWNSISHTNSLVPLYVYGRMPIAISYFVKGYDPIRGVYIDNTDIYRFLKTALSFYEFIYLPMIAR
jgi:alkaline phosphatase